MNTEDKPTVALDADKTCTINVHNMLGWSLDDEMLDAVLHKCARHLPQAKLIDVYPQERVPADAPAYKNPGWLEWGISITYRGGGGLFIGAIQRKVGAEFEFHT